jgi:hypothetical protein
MQPPNSHLTTASGPKDLALCSTTEVLIYGGYSPANSEPDTDSPKLNRTIC